MNNTIKTISLVALLATLAPAAHAGLFLEPFAGYQMGTLKQTGEADAKYKTTTYGARAGYQKLGLMVGAEYQLGQGEDDRTPKRKLTSSAVGVTVGYTFPVLLRAYATYSFNPEVTAKADGVKTKYDGGNAIKAGVGLTLLPLVSLNVEYVKAAYPKTNGSETKGDLDGGAYGLSLSLPLSL